MNPRVREIRPSLWPTLLLILSGISLLAIWPAQASAEGTGSISGKVTNDSGEPQPGICVKVYDSGEGEVSSARSDSDGNYSAVGLEAGDYRLEYRRCATLDNVLGEFYNDKETLADATPVTVAADTNTSLNDVQLATGGSISGTVTGTSSGPQYFCLVSVTAYDADGEVAGSDTTAFNSSSYRIDRLKTGDYRLQFNRGCVNPAKPWAADYPAITRFYDGVGTLEEATPVSVTAGQETTGIDADLVSQPDPGGSISGQLTDSAGDPLVSSCVLAYNSNGVMAGLARTDANGEYSVTGLDPGKFRLEFRGCENNAAGEFYEDKASLEEATPVEVKADSNTEGINAQLVDGGSISGTITDRQNAPLGGICVVAFDSEGRRSGFDSSKPGGDYRIISLNTGSYRLEFSDCFGLKPYHVPTEFYEDKATFEQATPVAVTAGSEQANINAQMSTPGGNPVTYKATIDSVKVKGPARPRLNRVATFRVKITNTGNAEATGVRLKVSGRRIGFDRAVGAIPAANSRTVKVRLRPRKRGKAKLAFRVTTTNAGDKVVMRRVFVRK